MKYALLIYPGRAVEEYERLPEEEQRSILDGRSRTRRRFSAASTCSRRTTSIGLPFVAHRNVLFTVACDLSRDATARMLVGERPDARGR